MKRPFCALLLALTAAAPAFATPPARPPARPPAPTAPAHAAPKPPPPKPQPWSCLDYRAEQLVFKGKTRVCARKASAGEMHDWLPAGDPKEPKLPEPSPGGRLMRLAVDSDLAGRLSQELTFFEPDSGRALQRTKVKLGSDPYRKSYRFGEAGLEWTRSAPKSREESERADPTWSKIENFSAPYPKNGQCRTYSEPALLLYLVAGHDWSAGKPLELCMFNNKHWSRVEAVSAGLRSFAATYRHNDQERKLTEARVVVLKASQASPEESDDPLELMGLRGNLELYLDPLNGLPVAIQGEMPWMGVVTVRLEKAETGG